MSIKTKPKNGHANRITSLPPGIAFVNVNRFMTVIPPGTKVALGPKMELEAIVLETTIKEHGYVFYRVAWWSGNERKTEWLEASEVHNPAEKMTVSIGFG